LVRWKSIVSRQIETFLKAGISDIHISVPLWTLDVFKSECKKYFPQNIFYFYEQNADLKTGDSLKNILSHWDIWEKLFISNGDNFYGSLDIEKYYEFYKRHEADFAFCLKFVMTPEQLWNVVIQWEKVIDFVEKPKAQASYLTNSWLYISSKNFLEKHNYWSHLEIDFFPYITHSSNVVWFLYSWEWEHIQNDSTYERVNGELL
jgi:NDP-sugar pyrophosphorylase family protein